MFSQCPQCASSVLGAEDPAVAQEMTPAPGSYSLLLGTVLTHFLWKLVQSRKRHLFKPPLSIAPGGSYFWVVTGGFPSLAQVAGPSPMFLLHISCHLKGVIPLPLTKHLAIWDYFVGKGLLECVLSFTHIVAPALPLDSWSLPVDVPREWRLLIYGAFEFCM